MELLGCHQLTIQMAAFTPSLSITEARELFPEIDITASVKEGGQGSVFRGVHNEYGDVAIKVLAPGFTTRTQREVDLLDRIEHEALLQIREHGSIDVRGQDAYFTVADFVDGDDLAGLIAQRGHLDEDEVRVILRDVSSALVEVWKERVVHRDIKPDNIRIRESCEGAVLIDLGYARHLELSTYTAPGLACGTPGYMSPEQCRVRALTVKTDVFGLGVTAFEALTGHHPFNWNQQAIIEGVRTTASARQMQNCDRRLSDLIEEMLHPRPTSRPLPSEVVARATHVGG